ncbi:MAG: signal peptidase I [Treponema sp.]|nr:signal peptidase I [Treponema sp.]
MEEINKNNGSKTNFFLCVLLGIAIALAAKAFVLDFYRVSGQSMEPAIKDGTFIAANKLAYGLQNPFKAELLFNWNEPKAGETVLYMYQNYWVVKRCVAIAGDKIECAEQNDNYCLRVNGQEIPLSSIQYHKLWTTRAVPQGYILAIGDNAQISHDSRDYGFVPIRNVVARAIIAKK